MYMFRHWRTALSKYEQLPEEARGDYGAGVPGGWELPPRLPGTGKAASAHNHRVVSPVPSLLCEENSNVTDEKLFH